MSMRTSIGAAGSPAAGEGWRNRVAAIAAIPSLSLVGWTADGRTLVVLHNPDGVPPH